MPSSAAIAYLGRTKELPPPPVRATAALGPITAILRVLSARRGSTPGFRSDAIERRDRVLGAHQRTASAAGPRHRRARTDHGDLARAFGAQGKHAGILQQYDALIGRSEEHTSELQSLRH